MTTCRHIKNQFGGTRVFSVHKRQSLAYFIQNLLYFIQKWIVSIVHYFYWIAFNSQISDMKGIVSIKYWKRNEPKENNLKSIKPFSQLVVYYFQSNLFTFISIATSIKTLMTSLHCYFNFKFQLNESLFQMNPFFLRMSQNLDKYRWWTPLCMTVAYWLLKWITVICYVFMMIWL